MSVLVPNLNLWTSLTHTFLIPFRCSAKHLDREKKIHFKLNFWWVIINLMGLKWLISLLYDSLVVFYSIPLCFSVTSYTRNNTTEINTMISQKYLPRKTGYLKELRCLSIQWHVEYLKWKKFFFLVDSQIDCLIFVLWSRVSISGFEISLDSCLLCLPLRWGRLLNVSHLQFSCWRHSADTSENN